MSTSITQDGSMNALGYILLPLTLTGGIAFFCLYQGIYLTARAYDTMQTCKQGSERSRSDSKLETSTKIHF